MSTAYAALRCQECYRPYYVIQTLPDDAPEGTSIPMPGCEKCNSGSTVIYYTQDWNEAQAFNRVIAATTNDPSITG